MTTQKGWPVKEGSPMRTTRQITLPDCARPRPRKVNSDWIVVGQDIAIWLNKFGRLIGPTGDREVYGTTTPVAGRVSAATNRTFSGGNSQHFVNYLALVRRCWVAAGVGRRSCDRCISAIDQLYPRIRESNLGRKHGNANACIGVPIIGITKDDDSVTK